MSGPAAPLYLDDLASGQRFETGERALTEAEIIAFARQWDPQYFHTDPEAARASPYDGLIASGFHTLLTAFVLSLETDVWRAASMGSPGMAEIAWLRPVRPGDRLRCVFEVLSVTPSRSRPDRGRAEIAYQVLNQAGERVMRYRATHILRRRPEEG
ncbi:MaoC family dehydratase [Paralimibaculum aggregatum]|uniref:MaoC family dehydratase n=1 Tax=Paralimibaculum aggregatum TaxID=3036245 RepID=A0ABQ6LG45_9RHOB|nr:MaoC family dehydratase [Limibaculum sp. NKW23]GMG82290.1 MaoC family dehydratase [Limibaculum sp. NKW23]